LAPCSPARSHAPPNCIFICDGKARQRHAFFGQSRPHNSLVEMAATRAPERLAAGLIREARIYSRALQRYRNRRLGQGRGPILFFGSGSDESRKIAARGGKFFWAVGGDYGPPGIPSDDNFCCNGVVNSGSANRIRGWRK